jgi:hypothetical protein
VFAVLRHPLRASLERTAVKNEIGVCIGNGEQKVALRVEYRRASMPRELIEPHKGEKRYLRRGKKRKFTSKQADVGRSLSADQRSKAKTIVKKGEGDRGDRRSTDRDDR